MARISKLDATFANCVEARARHARTISLEEIQFLGRMATAADKFSEVHETEKSRFDALLIDLPRRGA